MTQPSADIRLDTVTSRKDIVRFLDVTRSLYKDDPHWIQPLTMEGLDTLTPAKNPFFLHAEVALFIAVRGGQDVGRISLQIDSLAQEKWGPNLAHFGFFEAADQEVANALLNKAKSWALAKGMTRLQGPWSLSANEQAGLLVEGFDTPPVVMMPHGKPAYEGWLNDAGFMGVKDLWAYELDLLGGLPERAKRIVAAGKKNKRVSLRPINMKDYDTDIKTVLSLFNDAWSDNWGYVPFTEKEGNAAAKALKMVIHPRRTCICEVDGEPAAFMVTIPDVNDFIKDLDGKLFPFGLPIGLIKLLTRLKRDRCPRYRVPLMGVSKKFQKSPLGAVMAMWMIDRNMENVLARGATFGELSWILDDNVGMNKILIDIGCKRYKTYRIFEIPLA